MMNAQVSRIELIKYMKIAIVLLSVSLLNVIPCSLSIAATSLSLYEATFEAISYQCYITVRAFAGKPSFGKIPIIRAFTGWTEWTPDAVPIIDFANDPKNFFISGGYSGHGFCLGPISGEVVADMITEGKTRVPIENLRFDRFRKAN